MSSKTDLDEMAKELFDDVETSDEEYKQVDSLGREYSVPPGTKPLSIEFEDYPRLKNMAYKILSILGKTEHIEYIDSGFIAFTKTRGRKETNRKAIYLHGIRTVLQCFYGRRVGYIIEATNDFDTMGIGSQIETLLTLLYRIKTDRDLPTGKFVTYNSFRGYDKDLNNVIKALSNELENL